MPTSKIKGLDEQTLEGGVGSGAGGRSGITSSNSKLDNVFGIEGKALDKARPKQEKREPKEVTNYFEMTDAQRAELTPAQLRRLGSDATHSRPGSLKKGGTVSASRRADGIAQKGKTKGRMC
jgi:hypothetical protein